MACHLLVQPFDDLLSFLFSFTKTIRRNDVSTRNLCRLVLVVNTNDSDIINTGMPYDNAFQFRWWYLEALVLDQFLHTICNIEVAILILVAYISSFKVS